MKAKQEGMRVREMKEQTIEQTAAKSKTTAKFIKTTKATKANQSTEKALAIIEYLAEVRDPARLQDISKDLGINTSTALRFINTLENSGYVLQDSETLRYFLTMKICTIANKVMSTRTLRDISVPFLKQITRIFGEMSCLAEEHDMTVIYTNVHDGPDKMLRTMSRIGKIAPMHCTGVGKCLMLNYSDAEILKLAEVKGLPVFTKNTISTVEKLREELAEVRSKGYAYDNEECEIGARCVAVPVRDADGKVVASLSVTGPVVRMTDKKIDENICLLFEAADNFSKILGYEK